MMLKEFVNALEVFGLEDYESIKLIHGVSLRDKYSLLHSVDEYALYAFESGDFEPGKFIELVALNYPADYQLRTLRMEEQTWKKEKVIGHSLAGLEQDGSLFILFEPYLSKASLIHFQELIAHLRSPQGCPWDRKQNHKSLRTNLLEETYEVLTAIDTGDMESLKEELGDLLLQIFLHAQIASEEGKFSIFEVIHTVHQKITYRHPHVFKDLQVRDAEDVIRNWEVLKNQERKEKGEVKKILSGVPTNLPALSLAQKYQERAARVGFDWTEITPVFEKIDEEIMELKHSTDDHSKERELGDVLFAVVNLVRWYGFDAESLLREMSLRFKQRFEFIESQAIKEGKQLYELTLDEMDAIWERAKEQESKAA